MSTITKEDFINQNFITEEKESNFFNKLTKKQKEMYLVRKFVPLYLSIYGGTHEECLVALNEYCIKNGFKTRKTVKSISIIILEESVK